MPSEQITRKSLEVLPTLAEEDKDRAMLLKHVLVEVGPEGEYLRVGKSKIPGYVETPAVAVLNKDGAKIKSHYDFTDRAREYVFRYRVSVVDAPYSVEITQKPTEFLPPIKVEWLITKEHFISVPEVT